MTAGRLVLSLFSGPGGMDLGFVKAGFRPLLAIDHNPAAIQTYRRNHPGVRVEQRDLARAGAGDLISLWRQLSHEAPVGVIGGPPCQAFSMGNTSSKMGDIRRLLPLKYAGLLSELNHEFTLHFFVFENVTGLRLRRNQSEYELFRERFRRAGFALFEATLDAQFFGVPQRRPRLFLVGINQEHYLDCTFQFPEPPLRSQARTVRDAIAALPEPVYFDRSLRPEDIPHHPNHWTMRPRSWKFTDPNHGLNSVNRGRSFRVLSWDAPSWTVAYGNREVHIHPSGHRRLSVYEAMLLQGFPASYVLEGTLSAQISQVGDAVPPPVATALGTALCHFLDTHNTSASSPDRACRTA